MDTINKKKSYRLSERPEDNFIDEISKLTISLDKGNLLFRKKSFNHEMYYVQRYKVLYIRNSFIIKIFDSYTVNMERWIKIWFIKHLKWKLDEVTIFDSKQRC
jgi:hypothetical protein